MIAAGNLHNGMDAEAMFYIGAGFFLLVVVGFSIYVAGAVIEDWWKRRTRK